MYCITVANAYGDYRRPYAEQTKYFVEGKERAMAATKALRLVYWEEHIGVDTVCDRIYHCHYTEVLEGTEYEHDIETLDEDEARRLVGRVLLVQMHRDPDAFHEKYGCDIDAMDDEQYIEAPRGVWMERVECWEPDEATEERIQRYVAAAPSS